MPESDRREWLPPKPTKVMSGGAPPEGGSYSLSIRRSANAVEIMLTCQDDYAAIQLYDHLVASAERGQFQLGVKAKRG